MTPSRLAGGLNIYGRAQIQMSVGASKSGLFLKTGGRRGSGASEL